MVNKYELLTNLNEESETTSTSNKKEVISSIGSHQKQTRKPQLVISSEQEKCKVLIIGDKACQKIRAAIAR